MADLDERDSRRLDGWKAIANYFRRDRSTVMRWARDRDLPVRRMPGGKQGSVFAFEAELAAWALSHDTDEVAAAPATPSAADATQSTRRLRWRIWTVLAAVGLLLIAGAIWYGGSNVPPQDRLPSDPKVAADYVAARDTWARRTPADLRKAIELYRSVIRRDPGFAPAHAGLAEAWLIYREYGAISDFTAYRAAEAAASRALQLDRRLPAAHRAMAFIHYWRESDSARAIAGFKQAIALDDRDAQSHFWYANVLADLGDDATAQREYDRARLLSPGSRAIEVEQACSQWQAGRDRRALDDLTVLTARYPDDATIHNCLAWVHMSHGDIVNFTREYEAAAQDRGEPDFSRLVDRLKAAVARDPATAHRTLIAEHERQIANGERNSRETPSFFASAMGDRTVLMTELKRAAAAREHWYSATIRRRILARWRGDAEIAELVGAVGPVPSTASPSPTS